MTQPSDRVQLRSGRLAHAAHPGAERRFTLCGYPTNKTDQWLAADKPVTCRTCLRRMAEEGR